MSKFIILISCILFFSISCNKKIELNLPDYSSKLVVNGEMDTESEISLQVSRSLPIMQTTDSSGYLIKTATVSIFENGISIGNATYFSGRFVLNKKPKAGAVYRINVSSGNYTPVYSDVQIPKTVPFTVSFIDSIGLDDNGFKVGQLNLSFTDDGSVSNYYKLLIKYYNAGVNIWYPFVLSSNDILFLNNEKLNDGGYLFSDRTFSGKTKKLSFPVASGFAIGSPKFEITFKSFSQDYNDYLRATENYSQSGNGFSNDPVILKTNVINGLGMIGGVSNIKDTIF